MQANSCIRGLPRTSGKQQVCTVIESRLRERPGKLEKVNKTKGRSQVHRTGMVIRWVAAGSGGASSASPTAYPRKGKGQEMSEGEGRGERGSGGREKERER